MPFDDDALQDALHSVITIPIVPYRAGRIDFAGHARNVEYLMAHNALDGGRPRVISVAGTSLVHHMSSAEQLRIVEETARVMSGAGVLVSAIVPNPISDAAELVEAQSRLPRPPDAFLIMPLGGVSNPDGVYHTFLELGERLGKSCGARFLYYFRQERDREAVIRLLNDSSRFIGVKIGTTEDDVGPFIRGVAEGNIVIWGVGDRSTSAAELGARGHTSGISLVCARASDEMNNAQRRGDFAESRRIEGLVGALEEIRFRDGRMHNYSAVVEAIRGSGFDDVVGGEGGPFNRPVPPEVALAVRRAVEPLLAYH